MVRPAAKPRSALIRLAVIQVITVTAFGAWLRLDGLGEAQPWMDELLSWAFATQPTLGDLFATVGADGWPPAHYLILRGWIAIAGDSPAMLRLPGAVGSVLTIPALFWLGSRLRGDGRGLLVGLIAASWFALSPLQVTHAMTARGYGLIGLSACLILLAADHAFGLTRPRERLSLSGCGLFVLAALFGLCLHDFLGLLLAALGLGLAVQTRRRPRRVLAMAGVFAIPALAFLPWLLSHHTGRLPPNLAVPDWSLLTGIAHLLTGSGDVTATMLLILTTAVLAVLALRPGWIGGALPLPLVACALGPLLIALVLSWLWQPLLLPRYLQVSLPAVLVLWAGALVAIAERMLLLAGQQRWLLALPLLALLSPVDDMIDRWPLGVTRTRGDMGQIADRAAATVAVAMRQRTTEAQDLIVLSCSLGQPVFDYLWRHGGSDLRTDQTACHADDLTDPEALSEADLVLMISDAYPPHPSLMDRIAATHPHVIADSRGQAASFSLHAPTIPAAGPAPTPDPAPEPAYENLLLSDP